MKRIVTILGTTALLAGSANADNINAPYCIKFPDFCDVISLSPLGDGFIAGEWDSCGTPVRVRGTISDGIISVACTDQAQCPNGNVWLFNFDLASHLFDLFGYDRVNPPFPQQINQQFRIGHGACSVGEGSMPLTQHR